MSYQLKIFKKLSSKILGLLPRRIEEKIFEYFIQNSDYEKRLLEMLNLLPSKMEEEVFEYLMQRSEKLRRCARKFYYSHDILTDKRFDVDNIRSAVNSAKRKFCGCSLYLLTDHEITYEFKGVENISSVDEVKGIEETQVFICAFESDQKLIKALKKINKMKHSYYVMPGIYYPTARYFYRNDIAKEILIEERNIEKPKFEICDFENLIQVLEITRNVGGDYLEIGVYQGRSAHLAMNYMTRAKISRKCYFLDVFEGFNYSEAKDSADAIWNGTHTDTSMFQVKEFLSKFAHSEVIKSNIITDKLPERIQKIAVCNIDVDLQEAVTSSLDKVAPLMAQGGVIILEDQGHTPPLGGAYLATSEFLNSRASRQFLPIHMASGQMFLVKII